MRAGWFGQGLKVVACAAVALTVAEGSAEAARHNTSARSAGARSAGHSSHSYAARPASVRFARRYAGPRNVLQCVPFARENSGIELSGNAGTWWNSASGLYERGARPEVGSILNFRSTGHMRMGHVAVVTNVLSPRHIEIDHANWGAPGRISRNIDVVDVSANNDWTAVRVALSQAEDYGSTYPTFGFIYDRPDRGVMVANTGVPTSAPEANGTRLAARTELVAAPEEVAEAASDDDGTEAPRYSSRHRGSARSKTVSTHVAAQAKRSRGYSPFPTATTYRVSTHQSAPAKASAHKPGKRRL